MVAPVTKLLMAFGTPCARKDLSWCRVVVDQVSKSGGEEFEVEADPIESLLDSKSMDLFTVKSLASLRLREDRA